MDKAEYIFEKLAQGNIEHNSARKAVESGANFRGSADISKMGPYQMQRPQNTVDSLNTYHRDKGMVGSGRYWKAESGPSATGSGSGVGIAQTRAGNSNMASTQRTTALTNAANYLATQRKSADTPATIKQVGK